MKGPAQEIQFQGIQRQDEHCHIPMDVVSKITALCLPTCKKEAKSAFGELMFQNIASLLPPPLSGDAEEE